MSDDESTIAVGVPGLIEFLPDCDQPGVNRGGNGRNMAGGSGGGGARIT